MESSFKSFSNFVCRFPADGHLPGCSDKETTIEENAFVSTGFQKELGNLKSFKASFPGRSLIREAAGDKSLPDNVSGAFQGRPRLWNSLTKQSRPKVSGYSGKASLSNDWSFEAARE